MRMQWRHWLYSGVDDFSCRGAMTFLVMDDSVVLRDGVPTLKQGTIGWIAPRELSQS